MLMLPWEKGTPGEISHSSQDYAQWDKGLGVIKDKEWAV